MIAHFRYLIIFKTKIKRLIDIPESNVAKYFKAGLLGSYILQPRTIYSSFTELPCR